MKSTGKAPRNECQMQEDTWGLLPKVQEDPRGQGCMLGSCCVGTAPCGGAQMPHLVEHPRGPGVHPTSFVDIGLLLGQPLRASRCSGGNMASATGAMELTGLD